jgi:alkylated DNA nucleotide flippase Atl1
MCIPVDSMLWALVARIRDEGYVVTRQDFAALIGSGCSPARAREVLAREGSSCPDRRFAVALATLDDVTG